MSNTSKDEPKTAPQADRWYNITLGPSFKDDHSNRFCTLRYEFKPASIDKSKPGTLHKKKENRVSVEFQNNQPGKPKVTFEGSSEDYKENDAVLFFDGETFRLERLHRAVKQLRHRRLPGDSTAAATVIAAAPSGSVTDPRLSPVGKAKPQAFNKSKLPSVPVEVERIDIGEPEISGTKSAGKSVSGKSVTDNSSIGPSVSSIQPSPENSRVEEHEDIVIEDLFGAETPKEENHAEQRTDVGFQITKPRPSETDDEIADIDDSDNEEGPNAAELLREQVSAKEEKDEESSSSSSSSGSSSSGSGSGSGSSSGSGSDSESSEDNSVNSV